MSPLVHFLHPLSHMTHNMSHCQFIYHHFNNVQEPRMLAGEDRKHVPQKLLFFVRPKEGVTGDQSAIDLLRAN